MSKSIHRIGIPGYLPAFKAIFVLSLIVFSVSVFTVSDRASAQIAAKIVPDTQFRVGEKLTYAVSFDRFSDVAFAEIAVVSRGALGDRDAVEIYSKIKTFDLVSAAFYLIDESRTTFAAADSGLPLYTSKLQNTSGLPRETFNNYLTAPILSYDLLSMLSKIRHLGGSGSLTLTENGKSYNVTFQPTVSEKVKTGAGEFDTSVIVVQSDYLTEIGLKDLRINLTSDEAKIPVLFRFRTAKGEFKAVVAGIQMNAVEAAVQPTPVPTPIVRLAAAPTPVATPTPYIENLPLAPELSFPLGESLDYQISTAGQPVASFTLQAKERKQFSGSDSLLLAATVTDAAPGNPLFAPNDFIRAQVDPETLGPQQINIKFSGSLASYNQSAQFDRRTSFVTFGGAERVEIPVGTHSILSLLYAIRSFNLKPSKDTTNPVNDTRVAVFWENKPYVFTLRPEFADLITLKGEKVSAQLITVKTGNPVLDQLNLKIWLSNDERRLPLRLSAGIYQADLVSDTTPPLK